MVKKSKVKSVSKSKSKPVKSKAVSKSVTKKAVPAKKTKATKQKSFSLPNTAQLPSVGELPELPSFEDFVQQSPPSPQAEQQDSIQQDSYHQESYQQDTYQQTPQQASDTYSQKPKLWWLSWLLPGKKQPVIDAQSTDVSAQESADTLTQEESAQLAQMPTQDELTDVLSTESSESQSESLAPISAVKEKKSKKKQLQQEEHVARAYEEVDTLKTRLDEEMRERQSAVEQSHERLKGKEAELEKWHDDLLTREKEVVKKEKEYERIKKLEAQLEDKEITLKYKEDEIEDLKNKLAEKELELTQQEGRLSDMAKRLERVQIEQKTTADQTAHVADDYHKLAKKHGHVMHHKVEPKVVLSKVVTSTDLPTKREIRNLLLKAYDQLAGGDMAGLQFTYNKIRETYSRMIATAGPDEQLYKDILDLYNDIKLAVMQRN